MALSGVEGFTVDVVDVDVSTASRSGIELREDSSLIFRGAPSESLIVLFSEEWKLDLYMQKQLSEVAGC